MALNSLLPLLLMLHGASDVRAGRERIDVYDPRSGAHLGHESTWYGHDGRRLRLEIRDASETPSLLFFVLHDELGRESEARYFEGGSLTASREVFTYRGTLQIVTYASGERTEIERDDEHRDRSKRYFRADGRQYGQEQVLWDGALPRGWDFSYVERDTGVSFRYRYPEPTTGPAWAWRFRDRDGEPERLEARSRLSGGARALQPVPFLPGVVSTDQSETSPSITADGRTLVFARYGEDWEKKRGFIAEYGEDGWAVSALERFGELYNLAISPDGSTIFYSVRGPDEVTLYRSRRDNRGWSAPENLTERFAIRGGYANLTETGDLYVYDAEGAEGAGIYRAAPNGPGFLAPVPVFTPADGEPFDAFRTNEDEAMLVTRCFDDRCEAGPRNGIWAIGPGPAMRKLAGVGYGWGAQPVPALGIFIYTDGEDILALPLGPAMR